MYDTYLNLRLGERRSDGVGESLEAIVTGDQDIFDATIPKRCYPYPMLELIIGSDTDLITGSQY